jgi:hypothetical protein
MMTMFHDFELHIRHQERTRLFDQRARWFRNCGFTPRRRGTAAPAAPEASAPMTPPTPPQAPFKKAS